MHYLAFSQYCKQTKREAPNDQVTFRGAQKNEPRLKFKKRSLAFLWSPFLKLFRYDWPLGKYFSIGADAWHSGGLSSWLELQSTPDWPDHYFHNINQQGGWGWEQLAPHGTIKCGHEWRRLKEMQTCSRSHHQDWGIWSVEALNCNFWSWLNVQGLRLAW